MKIGIFHRIPFAKARYDKVLDHDKNSVVYIGAADALAQVPNHLRCQKIELANCKWTDPKIIAKLKSEKIERIISLSEYDLIAASEVRAHLQITGPTIEETLKVRDKIKMKEAVANAGLSVPQNQRLTEFSPPVPGLISDRKHPLRQRKIVLKPVDGASSEGVEIFSSLEDLERRIKMISPADFHQFEIEDFIEGPIYHFDGWISEGGIVDFVPSQYHSTCLAYSQGQALGSYQIEDPDDGFLNWSQRVIDAIGIKQGAFHLEGILADGEMFFLEIANRVGGAGVAQTFEWRTGINLYHAHIAALLDRPELIQQNEKQDTLFGWFVLPAHQLASPFVQVIGATGFESRPGYFGLRIQNSNEPLKSWPKMTYQATETPFSGFVKSATSTTCARLIKEVCQAVQIHPILEPKPLEAFALG